MTGCVTTSTSTARVSRHRRPLSVMAGASTVESGGFPYLLHIRDGRTMTRHEQVPDLHAALRDVAVDVLGWDPVLAGQLADVAIRRWRTFERRSKPNKRTTESRVQDLVRGLRQASPVDVLYLEPGDFERLAPRFGEVLLRLS